MSVQWVRHHGVGDAIHAEGRWDASAYDDQGILLFCDLCFITNKLYMCYNSNIVFCILICILICVLPTVLYL